MLYLNSILLTNEYENSGTTLKRVLMNSALIAINYMIGKILFSEVPRKTTLATFQLIRNPYNEKSL